MPWTPPVVGLNSSKSFRSFKIKRFAPESSRYSLLSVSAMKQKGFERRSEGAAGGEEVGQPTMVESGSELESRATAD